MKALSHFVNSHSMSSQSEPEKPRKSPVQARSVATVQAIREATLQVLIDGGLARCTTVRVADRAGVSVGSIYQYYPNRRSMVADVVAQHLDHVVAAVEGGCAACHGRKVEEMASALVT